MKNCHWKKSKIRIKSQSGQAIVEYILILVVSLTLVLSLASVIYTPFQIFLNQFLGEYVSCLLDSGELPSLGSDSKQGPPSCPMPGFSGGSPVSIKGYSSGGSGGSSGSGGDPSASSANGDSSTDKDKNSEASEGSGRSGNGRKSGSRSSSGGGGSGAFNRSTAGDGAASSSSSKTIELADTGQRVPADFFKGNRFANTPLGLNQKKTKGIGLDGMMEQDRKKLLPKERGEQKRLEISSEFAVKSKKTEIKPPEQKAASVAEERDEGFNFGKIIRILFIIAIIIILIALIGGQVAQMMKSWEK